MACYGNVSGVSVVAAAAAVCLLVLAYRFGLLSGCPPAAAAAAAAVPLFRLLRERERGRESSVSLGWMNGWLNDDDVGVRLLQRTERCQVSETDSKSE